jgi:hypothetical protein
MVKEIALSAFTTHDRVGFFAAVLTAAATFLAFGLAMIAIPIAGANCPGDCISYPYLDTVEQFPRDYLWMLPAMVMVIAYLVLMVALEAYAGPAQKIYGRIAVAVALISATVLLMNYFVQFFVVPVSLQHGETEGITILTMYNPHGLFIVLEDLGYLLMSLSFLFVAPIITAKGRLEAAVRWIFVAAFVLTVLAFIFYSVRFGLDRQDRFEVAAIVVNWLTLIVNGILLSRVFRRRLTASRRSAD